MKITPIEIRQKEFERVFRGYEKEAVDAFLKALSQEWERVADDNRALKIEMDLLKKEVNRMKDLEGTMFRALKGAEEAKSKYAEEGTREVEKRIEEATKEVESRLAQAQTEADEINREAHKKANLLIADAESQAKFVLDEAIAELRGLERDFKAMERYKEQMVNEFKSFTNETLEHINRFEEKLAKNSYQEKMDELSLYYSNSRGKHTCNRQQFGSIGANR
jgi:cell division initiation protein